MQNVIPFTGAAGHFATKGAMLSTCGTMRWTLTRRWAAPDRMVCFIGHNPSTADHEVDDPTVRRWKHFAEAWGYAGFVAVNLLPWRTPDPATAQANATAAESGIDHWRDELLHNGEVVIAEAKKAALVVACWGAIAGQSPEMTNIINYLMGEIHLGNAPFPDIYCFGLTASGHPVHPMARGKHRVPDDAQPSIYRAAP